MPTDIAEHERKLVRARRESLFGAGTAQPPGGTRALALSGGGIRSATFALGVVQAIAEASTDSAQPSSSAPGGGQPPATAPKETGFKQSLLSTFDYLSTVSGGGYLGGFICSLFVPGRLRDVAKDDKDAVSKAADDAARVLASGPPSRIRRSTNYDGDNISSAPLAWLRENGRYLTPTGMGDAVYAVALILRNWLSLHFVIGLLLVFTLSVLILARTCAGMQFEESYGAWEKALLCQAMIGKGMLDSIWWSPLSVLCVVPVLTFGIWSGVAYWTVMENEDGSSKHWYENIAYLVMAVVSVCCLAGAALAHRYWVSASGLSPQESGARLHTLLPLAFMGVSALIACIAANIVACTSGRSASRQRQALTQGVANSLLVSFVLLLLAVVDTLGQSLYLAALTSQNPASTWSPAGVAAALVWVTRHLASSGKVSLPDWVPKFPLLLMAGLAGIIIFILVGGMWAMFVHWLAWGGAMPSADDLLRHLPALLGVAGVAFLLSFFNGFFAGFLNQSSMQYFYASRLTRTYLGASNRERFVPRRKDAGKAHGGEHRASSSAEPMRSDHLKMENFYKDQTLQTFAPVHIINVTMNKTVDPTEQLVQRDRKGVPLAVLPWGLSLDGWSAPFPRANLNVGQWIATSGAAFATGIGRETSLGMSLLMGAANMRLGIWLDTGLGQPGSGKIPFLPGNIEAPMMVRKMAGGLFKTQRYLSYELQARFHGTDRMWQYLSDGGHFENTAIYELLRSEREVDQIFACDNGADPDYGFSDLGNLIRLAKIDLHADITLMNPALLGDKHKVLKKVFGAAEDFKRYERKPAKEPASDAAQQSEQNDVKPDLPSAHALLLYAVVKKARVVQIVLIKPNATPSAPLDIRQHAGAHTAFPQDTTADQFFDEAQWESYRALGYWQGKAIFNKEILCALAAHHEVMRTKLLN